MLELRRLQDKLERLRGKLADATNPSDEDEYEDQIRRLKPRITTVTERFEKLSTPPVLADLANALGDEDKVRAKWAEMTLPAQKQAIRKLFDRINIKRAEYRGQPIEDRLDVRMFG